MRLAVLPSFGTGHFTLLTLLGVIGVAWLVYEVWQPFEGRFTLPWSERPLFTVGQVHARVRRALDSLPSGPVTPDIQLGRFHARLQASPVSDWVDTYCRDFETNPAVLKAIMDRLGTVLELAQRSGREAALRHHGERAAALVPSRHRAEWETAAVLAAWALVLRDRLEPDDFRLLYGPFTAVLPVLTFDSVAAPAALEA